MRRVEYLIFRIGFSRKHCTELLAVRGNLHFCNVCEHRQNCGKPLYHLTSDRAARCGFYPAFERSWSAPPRSCAMLRQFRSRKSQAKSPGSKLRADLSQSLRRPLRRCRRVLHAPEARMQERGRGIRLFADPTRNRCGSVRCRGERTREWR